MTCPNCNDEGWTVDHSDECYAAGECVGCSGVQVPCDCETHKKMSGLNNYLVDYGVRLG